MEQREENFAIIFSTFSSTNFTFFFLSFLIKNRMLIYFYLEEYIYIIYINHLTSNYLKKSFNSSFFFMERFFVNQFFFNREKINFPL